MTQHKGQAEGKNAYHYNADNKSPRRAPQGPLLGSCVNHCLLSGLREWRRIVHCHPWSCNISCDQQRNEDHGSTQAGSDQSEERKVWAVFWHFKLLIDNAAQGQRLP
jgi:hypothetical protein